MDIKHFNSIICVVALIAVFSFIMSSCAKQNEEDLQPPLGAPCDTANSTFSGRVLPIIQANCYSCHGNGNTEGGMNLDGYMRIKNQVNNGKLLNVISHTPGFVQMPYGLPKLAQCDINKIAAWIKRGAINN